MDSDETKLVNGHTITARDHPGPSHSGGCYRHYEIGELRFDSLEAAEQHAESTEAE